MPNSERALPVQRLLQQERHGVLCTSSKKLDGWPFGSLTPYALSSAGEPLFLLSGLAEHTHNLLADARCSLFVQDSMALANPQAGARATLVGLAERVAEDQLIDARTAYTARFPESAALLQMGDFGLFQLKIERVRYIGGFGEMYWLSGDELSV